MIYDEEKIIERIASGETLTAIAAARELLGQIRAPHGAVNTTVGRTPSDLVIRVLVDQSLLGSLPDVPSSFHGHPVVVERRQPSIAG